MRLFKGRGAAPTDRARGLAVRALLPAVALVLVLFHLRLFWQHLIDQSVLEPVVAVKWLLSAFLVAGLWRLRMRGYRLLGGRRAGVFWLVALLLHVQVPVAPAGDITGAPDLGWVFALPATVSLGATLALTLGFAVAIRAAAAFRPAARALTLASRSSGGPLLGSLPILACRPPPALS